MNSSIFIPSVTHPIGDFIRSNVPIPELAFLINAILCIIGICVVAFGAALGYLVMGMMHSVLAGFTVSGFWFIIFSGYHLRKARAYSAVAVA